MGTSLHTFDTPRQIPLTMKFSLMVGNVFFLIGFIFTIFGLLFIIPFSFLIDFSSMSFGKDLRTTSGEIAKVEKTNSSENNQYIYELYYRYSVNDAPYTGLSYEPGSERNVGDFVNVEYEAAEPGKSRIEGTRMSPFPIWIIFLLLIFPAIGMIFLAIAIRKGLKNIYLVTNGVLTKGKIVGKEPTNTRINNRRVYEMFFTFKTFDGTEVRSSTKTHNTYLVEDEPEEMLVYDSNKPEDAVLLDTLGKSVRRFFEAR